MLLRIGGTLQTPVPRHRSSHLTSVNFLSTYFASYPHILPDCVTSSAVSNDGIFTLTSRIYPLPRHYGPRIEGFPWGRTLATCVTCSTRQCRRECHSHAATIEV